MKTQLLEIAIKATLKASLEVKKQYENGFTTDKKADGSFVTSADLAAHDILCEALSKTDLPILSEEGNHFDAPTRQAWETYWCLDPIDGTRDFVNKTDEFCVCTGLIHQQDAYLGVIGAPGLNTFYFGSPETGAFKIALDAMAGLMDATLAEIMGKSTQLPAQKPPENYTFLVSRYFKDEATQNYLHLQAQKNENMQLMEMGSEVKFCLMAEGKAHELTRFRDINYWDIAPGEAIAKAAGLQVVHPETKEPIKYTGAEIKIPGYQVVG